MSSSRLTRLRLAHVQMELRAHKLDFADTVEQHRRCTDAIEEAIVSGERERLGLAESLERLRLSKVIEALRRVNIKEDFNGALKDLISRLREISGILPCIDGVTMRNMLPVDLNVFLVELENMTEIWQSFDSADIELSSLHRELKQVSEKLREMDDRLRLLVIQDKIAHAI